MLKESIKFLAKDTILYGTTGAVSKFLAIFTVPILTRILTQEDYGTIDAVNAFVPLFTGFAVLGQDSAIARFFYDKGEDLEYRKKIATIGLVLQLIFLTQLCIVLILFAEEIGGLIFSGKTKVIQYWLIAVVSLPGSVFFLYSINIFKWTFQRRKYLFISLGNSILQVSLVVYFVLFLNWGVWGAIIPNVVCLNLFGIIGLVLSRDYIKFEKITESFNIAKEMILYGLPFTGVMIITSLMPSIDRFFLLRYSTLSDIGIYLSLIHI